MSEQAKRQEVGKGLSGTKAVLPNRKSSTKGKKYPTTPSCRDGQFEGTAAGKTKRSSL